MKYALSVLPFVFTLAACEPDRPTQVDSELPQDKTGEQLDEGDQGQLCEAADDYARSLLDEEELRRLTCRQLAVFQSLEVPGSDCEALYQGCLAEPVESGEGEAVEDCGFASGAWDGCTATVGEIEACYTEVLDIGVEYLRSLSCDRLDEYAEELPRPAVSAACEAAAPSCPYLAALLPGDDEE